MSWWGLAEGGGRFLKQTVWDPPMNFQTAELFHREGVQIEQSILPDPFSPYHPTHLIKNSRLHVGDLQVTM